MPLDGRLGREGLVQLGLYSFVLSGWGCAKYITFRYVLKKLEVRFCSLRRVA